MSIRFVKNYRQYAIGDVRDFGRGINEIHVNRGLAEWVSDDEKKEKHRGRPKGSKNRKR